MSLITQRESRERDVDNGDLSERLSIAEARIEAMTHYTRILEEYIRSEQELAEEIQQRAHG